MEISVAKNLLIEMAARPDVYGIDADHAQAAALAATMLSDLLSGNYTAVINKVVTETLKHSSRPALAGETFVQRATSLLLYLGINPGIKGFTYIIDALCIIDQSNGDELSMTKMLYPGVAELHETTAPRVERAIRHSLDILFEDDRLKLLNHFSRLPIYSNDTYLPSSRFLYTVYQLLKGNVI